MRSRNHAFAAALGLVCVWGAAQADVKDPLPDSLSLGGVTLYATSMSATPIRVTACR
jgi:hypothetical protein